MPELSRVEPGAGTNERDGTAWNLIGVKAWQGPAVAVLRGLTEGALAPGHQADVFRRASSPGG